MRNKAAKALRRSLKYKINTKEKQDRDYQEFDVESTRKHTARYDPITGEVKAVRGNGQSTIIECVSGDRKMYKYLKRKYMNFNHEEVLTPLPDQGVMDDIQEQYLNEARENAKGEKND